MSALNDHISEQKPEQDRAEDEVKSQENDDEEKEEESNGAEEIKN